MKFLITLLAAILAVNAETTPETKDKRGTSSKSSNTVNAIPETNDKQNSLPSPLLQYAIPIQYLGNPGMKPLAVYSQQPQPQPIMLVIPQLQPQIQAVPYQSLIPQHGNSNFNQMAQTLLQYYQSNPAAKYQLLHNPYSQFTNTPLQPVYYNQQPGPVQQLYSQPLSQHQQQQHKSSSHYELASLPHGGSSSGSSQLSANPSLNAYQTQSYVPQLVSPHSSTISDNLNTNEYYVPSSSPGEKLQPSASTGYLSQSNYYSRNPYRMRY